MTLYMIGLGLGDKEDITVKGLNKIKECDFIYLEHYTSILPGVNIKELEEFYGKDIILASRNLVEQEADLILNKAKDYNIAFLVVGDVFGATTHTDLYLRAIDKKLNVKIVNNASILNVVGNCGLELYKFGKTTSMVFFDEGWKPKTPYEVLAQNKAIGLHTLILLDIKVSEPSKESLKRGLDRAMPPRFMSASQGLDQFLELEDMEGQKLINEDTKVVCLARVGTLDQKIIYGRIKDLIPLDLGGPLHSIIIPGKLHFIEEEALKLWEI